MSLLLPALAGGGLWLAYGQVSSMKKEAVKKATAEMEAQLPPPYQGAVGHIKDRIFADTRGRFVRMREDIDERGAQIFLVDYGNGQEVVQYVDPRILL